MTNSTGESHGGQEGGKASGVTAVPRGPGWFRNKVLFPVQRAMTVPLWAILGLALFRHLVPPAPDLHQAVRVMAAVPLLMVWFLPVAYLSEDLDGKRPGDPYCLGSALGTGARTLCELWLWGRVFGWSLFDGL